MSSIKLESNASGTGIFTIASPNSNTNRTLTLPDATGTVVVTGGAQTIEFAAGSSSAPSITTTGDTNTGIFFPAADTIAFAEGGAEAMRINSSGNVGIGTSSPGYKLDVYYSSGNSSNNDAIARFDGNASAADGTSRYIDLMGNATVGAKYLATGGWGASLTGYSVISFSTGSIGSTTERARITSDGNLLVNTAAASGYGTAKVVVFSNLGAAYGQIIQDTGTNYNTSAEYVVFTNSSGSRAGSIQHTAVTTVAYNTSSDERLKKDCGVATDTSVIDNTVIHNFNWLANGAQDIGVFAQEAYLVKPSAVSVGSDELTKDGNLRQPWGIDYSKYVPDLIVYCQQLKKSIQELSAKNDALEARLAALEAK